MKALRIPRSGSMILTMSAALVAVGLLPVVFMAALAQTAEAHPRSLVETLHELVTPIRQMLTNAVDHIR